MEWVAFFVLIAIVCAILFLGGKES